MKKNNEKLFFLYIKQRRRGLLSGLLFCVVFAVSFALYRLPVAAVAYPAGLCFALTVLFFTIDFFRVCKKHKEYTSMKKLTAETLPQLPKADGIEERDLEEIVELLKKENFDTVAEAAEKFNKTVEYYTVWAHQIKTPISAMKLTLQNEDSPSSRQLSSELFRIEQYVDMVMAYLRLNSETSDFVFKKHSADRLLRNSVKRFSAEFIGRKIKLSYEIKDFEILTDEKWFSFVFEQILSNALKYTPPEGTIRIFSEKPSTVCIADTGIGIAEEDLPRIFEKGYTGKNGRSDLRASGIGLYLCKTVCDRLGCGIAVQSKVGKGTTVTLSLDRYDLNLTEA